MSIEDLILVVLVASVPAFLAYVYYSLTYPVPGKRVRRRIPWRNVHHVTRILAGQKIVLTLIIGFVFLVRLTGGFPGREWVALLLYLGVASFAWAAFIDLRNLQRDAEHPTRKGN